LGGNDRKHYFTGRQNCNSAIIPNTKRNSNSRESPHVSAVFVTAAFWAPLPVLVLVPVPLLLLLPVLLLLPPHRTPRKLPAPFGLKRTSPSRPVSIGNYFKIFLTLIFTRCTFHPRNRSGVGTLHLTSHFFLAPWRKVGVCLEFLAV
jgi:hypothetical protein